MIWSSTHLHFQSLTEHLQSSAQGQIAVPRASVGSLMSSQCNDSNDDYVPGGLDFFYAFLFQIPCGHFVAH